MDPLHTRRAPLFLALVLGLSLGTVGCGEKSDKTGATGEVSKTSKTTEQQGDVVATVNGEPITEAELTEYRSARSDSVRVENREVLLDELVTRKVIYQEALRNKLDSDPEVIQELEKFRANILVSAVVRKAMKDSPITDEALRAEYDQLKGRMVSPEYKASHILVKEEQQARKIIEQLNQGANFAELAREHSTDASGKNGGDLGWFLPQQMVEPFAQAVGQLDKGSYTSEPVKTQFGWHVIKLDDRRQAEPPAFEEVKGRLEQMLQQRRIGEYIQALKDSADISIKGKADVPAEVEGSSSDEEQAETSNTK